MAEEAQTIKIRQTREEPRGFGTAVDRFTRVLDWPADLTLPANSEKVPGNTHDHGWEPVDGTPAAEENQ